MKQKILNRSSLYLSLLCLSPTGISFARQTALEAASQIAGSYRGAWVMYGYQNGNAVEKSRWTDVLTAKDPTLLNGRAQVSVIDLMTYPDGTIRTSAFVEGYLSNPDGTAGDRFYEMFGSTVAFQRLAKDDWSFRTTPNDWELTYMGFDPKAVISASHTTIKSTTYEGTTDTDHVTRVTTVQWKVPNAKSESAQFVSMKGFHTRTGN